jgi:hypothetical protein
MKKHLLSLLFLLSIMIPTALLAQSVENAKGKHGGYLVTGEHQLSFEIVDDGTTITFYPVDTNGEAVKNAPELVDISIVMISTAEQVHMRDVRLTEGAYKVVPERPYPLYMYAISYTYNDQKGAVKFRIPGVKNPR